MVSRNATYIALTPEYSAFGNLPRGLEHEELGPDALVVGEVEGCSARETNTQYQWLVNIWRNIWEGFVQKNTGLLLVAISQVFFSLMNVTVKLLNGIDPPVSAFELILVRMLITYVCSVSYMYLAGIPDPFLGPKEVRHLLLFRGFIGFFGLFGLYYSLQYLSLSDATVLTFLAPMCTIFTGAFFLGEIVSRRQVLAGVISLAGVVLIARPNFLFSSASNTAVIFAASGEGVTPSATFGDTVTPTERLIAVGVALIGVLGATGAFTTLRAIGKRAHPLHSLTFFSCLSVIVATIAMISTKTPFVIPSQIEWLVLLILVGIFGLVAQILLTMGLARETAGRGTMAVYTQIVFASILERLFLHNVPTALSVIGTILILGSALYVAVSKESKGATAGKVENATQMRPQTSEQTEMEEGLLAEHNITQERHNAARIKEERS